MRNLFSICGVLLFIGLQAQTGLQDYNVTAFGALPDGITNNAVAIQLAIDRAAHLRRNAEGVALAFGHQHGFDGFAVLKADEISLRAVGGLEDLRGGG